jgi:hypothetical protein
MTTAPQFAAKHKQRTIEDPHFLTNRLQTS